MKKPNIRKWLDGFVLAGKGIWLARKEKRFWIGFIIAFLFFGTLMSLLSGGYSKLALLDSFSMAMRTLGESFLGIFGFNMAFADWIFIFLLAVLQGILIGLIALLWKKKKEENAANVEKAGIITGLIALGAGCPTCGTTLLTPLIGTIFSTGGAAITGTVSIAITIIAIIVAILSLRRLGEETYVIIINERYMKKKEERERKKNS